MEAQQDLDFLTLSIMVSVIFFIGRNDQRHPRYWFADHFGFGDGLVSASKDRHSLGGVSNSCHQFPAVF